jgi:hypothetical protein
MFENALRWIVRDKEVGEISLGLRNVEMKR